MKNSIERKKGRVRMKSLLQLIQRKESFHQFIPQYIEEIKKICKTMHKQYKYDENMTRFIFYQNTEVQHAPQAQIWYLQK